MSIPVEIIVTDPVLMECGGPPVPASVGAGAVDLVALGLFGLTSEHKPDTTRRRALVEPFVLQPGTMVYVCVGFRMHILDPDYVAHIIPRSSSAAQGIRLGNGQGLVDADYQGPLMVCVENRLWGTEEYPLPRDVIIHPRERIAQMLLAPRQLPQWRVVGEFSTQTARAGGGFGSTGRI